MNKYFNYETCPDCGASAFPYQYFGSNEWEYKCMADGWHRFKVSKAEPVPTLPELDSIGDGPIDGYDY